MLAHLSADHLCNGDGLTARRCAVSFNRSKARRGRVALTSDGHKALLQYVAQAFQSGNPHKATIREAVLLTQAQRTEIAQVLRAFWRSPEYRCPLSLDLKPRHGYESRVIKDRFPASVYAEWIRLGCSDTAAVAMDGRGRPYLRVANVRLEGVARAFELQVPIRSTADGNVHIDGVIPKGLSGQ